MTSFVGQSSNKNDSNLQCYRKKCFQHQKYSSFFRQVHGWGFRRIFSGPDYNSFYHELFLPVSPDLSLKMKRPSKRRQATPPNFYLMPPVSESEYDCVENSSSSPSAMLDEYWNKQTRRLSGFSLQEKVICLQTELDRLEKKRAEVHRLQLMRNQSREEHQPIPERIYSATSAGQLPFQRTVNQSQQQLHAPLDPWIHQAAQLLFSKGPTS